jgi:hypothetical protein
MMTPNDKDPDAALDDLLGQMRAAKPQPSAKFMARVLADAAAAQPARPRAAPPRPVPWWVRIGAALGGAGVVAGIGSAAFAGLVIGYVQPEPMLSLASSFGLASSESLEVLPGFDALLTEDLTQ